MRPGDVLRFTNVRQIDGAVTLGWKAPRGKVYVAVLLGVEDKDGPDELDTFAALERLGWNRDPEEARLDALAQEPSDSNYRRETLPVHETLPVRETLQPRDITQGEWGRSAPAGAGNQNRELQ